MNLDIEYIKSSATEDIALQYINNPDGYKSVAGRCPVREVALQANLIRSLLEKIESLQGSMLDNSFNSNDYKCNRCGSCGDVEYIGDK